MMPNPIRYLLGLFRGKPRERRRAPRYDARHQFSVSLIGKADGPEDVQKPQTLVGHTRNVSETGFALVVPSLRLGTRKLDDREATLRIMLDLPSETVEIHAAPVRSYQLPEDDKDKGWYFIAARITQLSDDARAQFTKYLRSLRAPH